MKKFGLIGNPIAHSMSPSLFKAAYSRPDDQDGSPEFIYELIEGADFEASYKKFTKEYDGINVTAPFKEKAFAKAVIKSPECQKTGATNLLVKTPEGIKAYNSDYSGILLSLLEAMYPEKDLKDLYSAITVRSIDKPSGLSALVTGCGGAGKAAAIAAGDLGLSVTLINRTVSKAEAIAAALPEYGFKVRRQEDFRQCFKEADIVIYTLPGPVEGIYELTGDDFSTRSGYGKILLEANYKDPAFTPGILSRIQAANPEFKYIPGKKWLLYQAYTGYGLFTGKAPDLEAMTQIFGQ